MEPGGGRDAVGFRRLSNATTGDCRRQARGATGAVALRGRHFYVGARRVCTLRNGWVWRVLTSPDQLFQGRAISFRAEVLATARRYAPRGVLVRLPDGEVLTAGWPAWDAFAFDYAHPTFGPQRALPVTRWYRPGGPRVRQSALWTGGQA